jgi:uncharacterized protein (TIRG00374 family)
MVVVASIVLFFLFRLNFDRISEAFSLVRMNWIIVVALLNILNSFIEALRWNVFLSSIKDKIRLTNVFSAIFIGVTGNILFPFRIGDGARAYYLAKEENINVTSSLSTVVLDRIIDIGFFLVLFLVTALFFPFPSALEKRGLLILGVLIFGILLFLILLKVFRTSKVRVLGRRRQWLLGKIRQGGVALSTLRHFRRLLPLSLFASLSWLLKLTMVWVMFRAFHLDLPLIAVAVVLIFVNVGSIFVTLPGNLGSFELSIIAALQLFSINLEVAAGCAIVLHVVEVVPMLILGLMISWFKGYHFRPGSECV